MTFFIFICIHVLVQKNEFSSFTLSDVKRQRGTHTRHDKYYTFILYIQRRTSGQLYIVQGEQWWGCRVCWGFVAAPLGCCSAGEIGARVYICEGHHGNVQPRRTRGLQISCSWRLVHLLEGERCSPACKCLQDASQGIFHMHAKWPLALIPHSRNIHNQCLGLFELQKNNSHGIINWPVNF